MKSLKIPMGLSEAVNAAGMLLHINGKCIMGKLKSSLLS